MTSKAEPTEGAADREPQTPDLSASDAASGSQGADDKSAELEATEASARSGKSAHIQPAGWARVDSDLVLRGWATDRKHRDRRLAVDVFIDREKVARLPAGRFDPKLVELGEADGRYAFAYVIPERYRDNRPHSFSVQVEDLDFTLRSKVATFEARPADRVPALTLSGFELGRATGVLTGGQYTKSLQLELWSDGRLLDLDVETNWITLGSGGLQFELIFGAEALATLMAGPVQIAAPGMVEGGLLTPQLPTLDLALGAEINRDGKIRLQLTGETVVGSHLPLEIEISRPDGLGSLLREPVRFENGYAFAQAPPATEGALRARLIVAGKALPGLDCAVRRTLGQLHANGDFAEWRSGGPVAWSLSAGATIDRGFYAFPPKVAESLHLSGNLLRLEVEASDEERVLVSQPIEAVLSLNEVFSLALFARAGEAASLSLRLVDDGGAVLGELGAPIKRPWVWTLESASFVVSQPATRARIEVVVAPGPAATIDLAGVAAGAVAFGALQRVPAPEPDGRDGNVVVNAQLTEWPGGLDVGAVVGRGQIAKGWYGFNRRSRAPVHARPVLADEQSDTIGLAMAAEDVPEGCRLEIRLEDSVRSLDRAVVSFEMGMPAAARRLFNEARVALPEFVSLDRVMLLKRTAVATETGMNLVDETVVTPGRRLLVGKAFQRFDLPFRFTAAKNPSDFEWELAADEGSASEFFLVFEFRQPFAIAVRDVAMRPAGDSSAEERSPYLSLEDRNIALQADQVAGLTKWVSAEIAVADRPADGLSRQPLTWRWSTAGLGTVEVVICVHNAIEETLACLRSLSETTRSPHTVRIIDDGSAPTNYQRLVDFAAGKPWVSVHANGENRGYTFSADRGVRESDADWVVLLNSDTIVTRGWLEGLLEAAHSDPSIAFVGPLSNAATFQSVPDLYDSRNQWKTNDLPSGWTAEDMAQAVAEASDKAFPRVPLLNGFCTLMRRSVFLEVGGLNHHAFPTGYGEENDLCLRVGKAGYALVVADHVYVYHSKSASFGSTRRTELAKAGGKMLRELHPDVDLGVLTSRFRDTPALTSVRSAMRDIYDKHL